MFQFVILKYQKIFQHQKITSYCLFFFQIRSLFYQFFIKLDIIRFIYFLLGRMILEEYDNSELNKTAQKFSKQKQRLPKDIAWKLQYMLDYIHKCAKPISELTEQQRNQVQDLQQMNPQSLKYVFISIVNSILSPNLYCSFQKNCKIKVQGLIPRWISTYISFGDNEIKFTNRKKVFSFLIEDLECQCLNETQLEFKYRGVRKSKVKFQNQDAARSIVAKINQLIIQHQKEKKKQSGEEQILNQRMFQQSLSHDYVIQLKAKQNTFLAHKVQPKIHITLFLKGQFWNIYNLSEFLITQKLWNNKTVTQKIVQFQDKKFMIERRLQSSSFFSLERRTLTEVSFTKTSNGCYVIQQKTYPGTPTSKSIIASDINIKFTLDILSPKIIKVTIDCLFNAKGYCNRSNSRSMLIDLFLDAMQIQHKYNKLKQKGKLLFKYGLEENFLLRSESKVFSSINLIFDKQQKVQAAQQPQEQIFYSISSNRNYFFNQDGDIEKKNQIIDIDNFDDLQLQESSINDFDEQTKYKQSKPNNFFMKKNNIIDTPKDWIKNDLIEFERLRPKNYDDKISIQYIKIIKQKIYEKNYTKKRFNESQINNFICQTPWYDPSVIIPNGKQYEANQQNQLIFINYQLIKNQKDSLIFVIKQVGANIISGKSVLNVSLPVDIFQSRSLLERSCASFGCAPKYLKPVADADVYKQLKAIIGFVVTLSPLQLIMLKPFNPILGQTFQAYLGGVPIYYQQISHHPPISAYYMKCPQFTIFGNLVAVANVNLNSGTGGNAGKMNVHMRNGNQFQISFFPGEISGLIYGKRKYSICNRAFVIERKNRLVAEISAHKQSKGLYQWKQLNKKPTAGDLIGGIFKVKQKFLAQNPSPKSLMNHPGLKKSQIEQRKQMITGLWFSQIYIGQQIINKGITAYPVQYSNELLPSDANYRMDILMHRFDDLARSQSNKQILQNIQRRDRKLRQNKGQIKEN